MPAVSKKQQRFFALVQAYLDGKIKNPSDSVRRAAESMSREDVRHFASTKHDGLPEEKKAWSKTPVHIQNKNIEYDFESIEDACKYLASLGVLTQEEVLALLYGREPMINGFSVTYAEDKQASCARGDIGAALRKKAQALVLVDPHRKYNEDLRAAKVLSSVIEPEDSEKETEEEKARLNSRVESDKKDLKNITKALERLAKFLS